MRKLNLQRETDSSLENGLPDITEPKPIDESQEQKGEKQEIKINNIADFIRALEWSYDLAKDQETREKIGHQIVKIEMSLRSTDYSADKVKVEEMEDGTLGLFYTDSHQTAVSKDLLEDFSTGSGLIKNVLIHEQMHKEGIYDEGMAEIATRKKMPTTYSFYVTEQQKAKRVFFDLKINKALDLYDKDNPQILTNDYLKVELEKKYKNKPRELKNLKRESYLNIRVQNESDSLERKFRDAVPDLHDKLGTRNYSFRAKVEEILKNLAEKDK